MKIVHTGDWHLGQTLYNYERLDDHRAVLGEIAELTVAEQADVLIVAGDVFDTAQPSAAAQSLLCSTLVDIHRRSPQTHIVLTAGNHDSASRHEIFREAWTLAGVTAVGVVPPADDFEAIARKLIIPVENKGWVVALPYLGRRLHVQPELVERVLERVAELNTAGLPVVMTAHIPVASADFRSHQSFDDDAIVGNVETVALSQLGTGYDYLALGHIHNCQCLDAQRRVWYSGTPMFTSFDEYGPRTVNVVEISRHDAEPLVVQRQICQPAQLLTIPERACCWDDALVALKDFDSRDNSYLRLNVTQNELLPPDAGSTARRIAADKLCRFCTINYKRLDEGDNADEAGHEMSVEEFIDTDPMEIARRYYAARALSFDEDTEARLREIIDEINQRP